MWDAAPHVAGKVPPMVPGLAESLSPQGTGLLENFSI